MHATRSWTCHVTALALAAAISLPSAVRAQGGFSGPGRYQITNIKSGRVIDLDRNDRTTVIQFSARNTDNQFWDIRAAEPGFWFIRNAMTGAALEAMGMANSTPVRGAPFTGSPSQQWRIEPGRDGNALITSRLGKTLDIPDGTSRDGARIQTYDVNGDANQRFQFRRIAGIVRDDDRERLGRGDAYSGRYDDRERIWRVDGDGVCFYRETGYRGRAFCVRAGQDIRRLPDEWAGMFQSVKFFGRASTVVVFGQPDFGGRRARILHDEPDLNRLRAERGAPLNRRITSFRVY